MQAARPPRARHLPKLALIFGNVGIGLGVAFLALGPLVSGVLPIGRGALLRTVLAGASLVTSLMRGKKGRQVAVLEFAAIPACSSALGPRSTSASC